MNSNYEQIESEQISAVSAEQLQEIWVDFQTRIKKIIIYKKEVGWFY